MPTPQEKARAIAAAIVDNITDRKGLRGAWDNLDDDTQDEIRREWETIIFEHIVEV